MTQPHEIAPGGEKRDVPITSCNRGTSCVLEILGWCWGLRAFWGGQKKEGQRRRKGLQMPSPSRDVSRGAPRGAKFPCPSPPHPLLFIYQLTRPANLIIQTFISTTRILADVSCLVRSRPETLATPRAKNSASLFFRILPNPPFFRTRPSRGPRSTPWDRQKHGTPFASAVTGPRGLDQEAASGLWR